MGRRTVDAGLECLPALLAGQVADAGLLVDGDGDGVLVVAEVAAEAGGEGLAFARAGGLAAGLLAFTLSCVSGCEC